MTEDDAGQSRSHHLEITAQGVVGVIGGAGGLLTTFVLVQPWTLYYAGFLRVPLLVIAALTAAFFAVMLEERRRRSILLPQWAAMFSPTRTRILWLIVAVCVVSSSLLSAWSPPTRQQIAQQILNDRGMFLRRLFYKTALEVANANGVALFHDAGFSPTLAFELLGEQAETVPAQRTVDVVLSLNAAELETLVPVVAVARASVPGYRLIDNLVRHRSSDAGVGIAGRTAPDGAPTEPNIVLGRLLSSPGIPLLGHAVLGERSEAVNVLLGLGANARTATLPLVRIGALPPRFDLLAVDPFLFVARQDGVELTRKTTLLEQMQAAGLTPSTFADSALAELGYASRTRPTSCSSADASDGIRHFLGYRFDSNEGYALGEFTADRLLGCTDNSRNVEGLLSFVGKPAVKALLTTPTVNGRTEGRALAGLSFEDSDGWIHFVGEGAAADDGFSATWRDTRVVFAGSLSLLEEARERLASPAADDSLVHCQFLTPLTLSVRPTRVECHDWSEVNWDVQTEPRLLAATHISTEERRFALTTEHQPLVLPPGEYFVSSVSLSDTVDSRVQVRYIFPRPRISADGRSGLFAPSWPEEPFAIRGRISAEEEQFVHVRLEQWADVDLKLTDLESDIDVFLTSPANSDIDYQSAAGGSDPEEISELLPPGSYVIRLTAFEAETPYTLELSSTERSSRGLSGNETVQGDGEALFALKFTASTELNIVVKPTESDVDVELLDGIGRVLAQSSLGNLQADEIQHQVEPGTFYIRVFPFGDEEQSSYLLSVTAVP